jgi:hypothetical protein
MPVKFKNLVDGEYYEGVEKTKEHTNFTRE